MRKLFLTLLGAANGLLALAVGLFAGVRTPDTKREPIACPTPGGQATLGAHPTIKIDVAAFARMHAYVQAASGELTLLGTAEYDASRNEIRIREFFLPVQTCSASHSDVGEEALARLLVEAVQRGIDTSTLRVWTHSHDKMEVFFSTTDEHSIQQAFPQADWIVSIVVNRAGDLQARLTQYAPLAIELDHLPLVIGLPDEVEAAIQAEVRQKVRGGYGWSSSCRPGVTESHYRYEPDAGAAGRDRGQAEGGDGRDGENHRYAKSDGGRAVVTQERYRR